MLVASVSKLWQLVVECKLGNSLLLYLLTQSDLEDVQRYVLNDFATYLSFDNRVSIVVSSAGHQVCEEGS